MLSYLKKMKYILGFLLVSILVFWYYSDSFLYEDEGFTGLKDVTDVLELLFTDIDTDKNGVLSLEEFLTLKNSHTVLQKNTYDLKSDYKVQEFPYFSVQLGEQILNLEVNFRPLDLSSLTKNVSDIPEHERSSLDGLLMWQTPFKQRHPFGAKSFSMFLPKKTNIKPGFLWWIIKPKTGAHSAPLPNQRYYPPQVDKNLLVLHALLSLFHPQPFLWTRFKPQGAVAIIRAIEEHFYDIVFRVHAEFQLNKPPLHPFWFTPSQFRGRLIINKDGTVVKYFHMEVPNTKLNVDMEWYNGPSEDSMEVDIGHVPEMSVVSSAISVPPDTEEGANQKLSSMLWDAEITMEEALSSLELHFFPFKQVKYHSLPEAFNAASCESKLVHGVVLWGNLADQSC